MAKTKKPRRHSAEFKNAAVEKMKSCESVVALAQELKINWSLLYKWRNAAESHRTTEQEEVAHQREAKLEAEIATLKTALAERAMEVDFFTGALQRVEALRRRRNGAEASTTGSGK